jgi:hypothetical protein
MCQIYLIVLLFGLVFIRISSANGSVCKNHPNKIIQIDTVYNIENCANTEINLGVESARTSLSIVKALGNQIARISDDTFKSTKQLTRVDLRENKIGQISAGAFEDQGNLQHLFLKLNKLTRIEVGTFDSLHELKELWLQNNQILLIEKGLFDQNMKLENLYLNENKIIAIESTAFAKLNEIKSLTLRGNLCINQDFGSNKLFGNFDCFENYETLYKKELEQIGECRSEMESVRQERDTLSGQLKSQSAASGTKIYTLVTLATIEFSIIIILLWKLKSKNGIEPSNGEPEIAVEGNSNENNLIYVALDLKPTNKTPIKSDEVIYSDIQNVGRPIVSAPAVPRNLKK